MSAGKKQPFKKIIIGGVAFPKDGKPVRIPPRDVTKKAPAPKKRKSA
ncbi:MAG: hypothetical protein M5U25_01650 [Planctomycetota bacterium]|nr:hypothetical protein [Planctomycetota bacterium]